MFFFNQNTSKYADGGFIKQVLPDIYYQPFKLKGNGKRQYNIFQSHNDSQLRQAAKQLFYNLSKDEHKKLAKEYDDKYDKSNKEYSAYVEYAFKMEFDKKPSPSDYRVSGIWSDKFSEPTKNKLRSLLDAANQYRAAYYLHEAASKYAEGGRVGDFDLVYQRWSKMMGGDGVSGTIRTKPANYYVASVLPDGTLQFDDLEANTRDVIDKEKVKELWNKKAIPNEPLTPYQKEKYEFAKGGEIKNQYENMAASQVWDAWSDEQRRHFLQDHNHKEIHETKVMDYSYDELPPQIQYSINIHTIQGQYADGGKVKHFIGWDGIPFEMDTRPFAVIAAMDLPANEILDEAKKALDSREIDEQDFYRIYDYVHEHLIKYDVTGVRDDKRVVISKHSVSRAEAYSLVTDAIKSGLYYDVRLSESYADGGNVNSDNRITVYRFNPMLIFKGGGYPIKSVSPTEWHIDKSKAMDVFNTFNHTLISNTERIEMMESNDGDTDADSNVWILAAVEAATVSQADYDEYLKDTSNDEIIGNAADYDFVTVSEKKFMPNGTKVPAKLYKSIYSDGGNVSGKIQIGANVHFLTNNYPKSEGYYGIVQRNVNHPHYSVDVYKNKKRILSDETFKNSDMEVIQSTQAIVLVISDKKPLYTQLNKMYPDNTFKDIEHESNPHLMFSPSINKYIIVFTNSYLQQVDKNVVKDNLDYIKKTYGVSRITWADKEAKKSAYAEMMYASGGKIDMKEHLCGCGMNFGEGGNIPEFNEEDFTKVMFRYITKLLVPFGAKIIALNKFEYKGKEYELAAWNRYTDTEQGRLFVESQIVFHELPSGKDVGGATFNPDTVTLEFEIDGLEIEFADKHHLPFEVDKTSLMKYPVKIWVNGTRDAKLELTPMKNFLEANYKAHQIWKTKRFSDAAYHIQYSDGEVFSGTIDLEPQDFHQPHNRRILSNHLTTLWSNVAKQTEPKFPTTKEDIEEAKEALKKYAFNDAVPAAYAHIIEYNEYQVPHIRLSSPDALENKEVRQAINWLIVNEGFTTYQIGVIMEFVAPDDVLKQIKADFTKLKNQTALMRDELAYPAMPYEGKQYAKGGKIEKDTVILPHLIAERVADEVIYQQFDDEMNKWETYSDAEKKQLNKKINTLKIKVINYLTSRANKTYTNNQYFANKVKAKGNQGRDYLYMMMQHWCGMNNGKITKDVSLVIKNYNK